MVPPYFFLLLLTWVTRNILNTIFNSKVSSISFYILFQQPRTLFNKSTNLLFFFFVCGFIIVNSLLFVNYLIFNFWGKKKISLSKLIFSLNYNKLYRAQNLLLNSCELTISLIHLRSFIRGWINSKRCSTIKKITSSNIKQ